MQIVSMACFDPSMFCCYFGISKAHNCIDVVFVLDDPLSAVDAHVGKTLFFGCIMETLVKRGKGVLLATHQEQYLPYADKIIVLGDDGSQLFFGTYGELQLKSEKFPNLDLSQEAKVSSKGNQYVDHAVRKYIPSCNSLAAKDSDASGIDTDKRRFIIQHEDKAVGIIDSSVFVKYLKAGGIFEGCFALFMAVVAQILLMMTDYWLKWWVDNQFWSDQKNPRYVWIYSLLVLSVML